MKYYNYIIAIVLLSIFSISCETDLEIPPQGDLTDETYWTNEENVRTFSLSFNQAYFVGYGEGYAWGDFFTGESLNDEFGATTPTEFIRQVPTSGGGWRFDYVRKANIFLNRVQTVPMGEEAIAHWSGVARFFRALEYADLVRRFGDVPWYETELSENDTELLYKPRDSREFVMDKVLEDLQFAAENVRVTAQQPQQEVNKDVVLAYMSRIMLFEGTWQKYQENNSSKAKEYLEASKWASNQVIQSGRYSLGDYRTVFNSMSLLGNPEVILLREYAEGELTHSLNSYVNGEPQTGVNKDHIESYLMSDGLPIGVSPLWQGDKTIEDVMTDRDPRIYETYVSTEIRLPGEVTNSSTTGYAVHKFLNEDIADEPIGSSNLNPTDAPVMRYGEVLMNYAEAAAELGTVGGPALTQADLDKSINVLRARPGIGMPALQVMGGQPAVNGTTYDDPDRDPTVSSMLWEIRRERRVELDMEGHRNADLKRWKKYEYLDMTLYPETNRGAWVDKAEHPSTNVELTEGDKGYIIPTTRIRTFDDPKVYLRPIPLDQITLYEQNGATLTQNPGW